MLSFYGKRLVKREYYLTTLLALASSVHLANNSALGASTSCSALDDIDNFHGTISVTADHVLPGKYGRAEVNQNIIADVSLMEPHENGFWGTMSATIQIREESIGKRTRIRYLFDSGRDKPFSRVHFRPEIRFDQRGSDCHYSLKVPRVVDVRVESLGTSSLPWRWGPLLTSGSWFTDAYLELNGIVNFSADMALLFDNQAPISSSYWGPIPWHITWDIRGDTCPATSSSGLSAKTETHETKPTELLTGECEVGLTRKEEVKLAVRAVCRGANWQGVLTVALLLV